MTLDEIHTLLTFKDKSQDNCAEINDLRDQYIVRVSVRTKELRGLEKTLRSLRELWVDAGAGASCAILERLSKKPPKVAAKVRGRVYGTH